MRITFVRHGQTADNLGRRWQGWGGSGLDATGRAQAQSVAVRLGALHFDRIVSSDLQRVVETSTHLERDVELDPVWRELDVGQWSGRTTDEVRVDFPEHFAAWTAGENVRIGVDGETNADFHERIVGAVRRLVDQHDGNDEILVFAHGGVIGTVVAEAFGTRWRTMMVGPVTNTALTTLDIDDAGGWTITRFNDASHLGHVPGYLADRKAANDPVITFVRHGLAGGNLADRWEGHTCSGLSEVGREQAARLGALMGPVERLVSSDTPRAAETASYLGKPGLDPGLREMWFGSWEGLEHSAVTQHHGDLLGRIYRDRQDLPRGGDGESWHAMTERVAAAVNAILGAAAADATVVSHGSAIRGFALRTLGFGWERAGSLAPLTNTGMARFVDTPTGRRLFDYGVAPHLGDSARVVRDPLGRFVTPAIE